jgi:hypothetical protein
MQIVSIPYRPFYFKSQNWRGTCSTRHTSSYMQEW